jgi:hypothetical protein
MIRLFSENTNPFIKICFQVTVILFLASPSLKSQILKGTITDKSGKPVQYATVYIQELKQGTTSDARGYYEIKLPSGQYTVFFQSLGYEPVMVNINLTDNTITKDVILPDQYYEIPEVQITPAGEDPAYFIMRRVIGLAPYHLNQVSYYKANVYLKGDLLIKKIPKLLQKSMRMNRSGENTSVSAGGKPGENPNILREGDTYLMESYNEIEFTAPDKYVQRVLSYNSTFPDQGNDISPMDYIQASFYQPVLAGMAISPLSPQAFSYYKFRYMGASLQGNYTINKIEVIPKRKSQQLFTGTIYIVEDLWCLHSVDLTNENLAGKIRVKEIYIPVQEDIWMPVSHQFDINLSILGIRADIGYTSSVKYSEVKANTSLEKPSEIATGFPGRYENGDTVKSKTETQIEKILQKEEMSNRDMVKLSNLMRKQSQGTVSDSAAKSLEVKDNTVQIVEKGAAAKDSTWWADIRPIPLSEDELKSIRKYDSIRVVSSGLRQSGADTIASSAKNKKRFRKVAGNILSGHTWSDTTGFSFTNGGLIDLQNLSFNTVDGFVYGLDFRISKRFKNQNTLSFYPDVRYAFSRKTVLSRLNINYSIAGMHPGRIFVNSGITSRDFNSSGGIDPFINSLTSLLLKKNYLKLYGSTYLTAGFAREFINGLNIEINAGFEDRHLLGNNTDFSIFSRSHVYTPNIPVNDYIFGPVNDIYPLIGDQKHFEFVTNVTFTPYQKYRISNGNKIPSGSDWPRFRFTWKHGINMIKDRSDSYNQYDMFRFEVSQDKDLAAFGELRWKIRSGTFISNRDLLYYDFFHFNEQPFPILIDDYDDAFVLPAYYSLSTPEFFGEAHLKYTSPYIILKLLPGLSNTLIRENLIFSFLGRGSQKPYTEFGYSLSEIFLLGEAGIYAGFDGFKSSGFGVRFVIRLR